MAVRSWVVHLTSTFFFEDVLAFFSVVAVNKLPQTGWIKTTNLFSHISGGQKSKSRYQQSWFLLEALRVKQPFASLLWVPTILGIP